MRRARQRCVTCPPSEWRVLQNEARAAGKTTSRYIVGEILDGGNRLVLTAEEQRNLRDRVNRLVLLCEDLVGALPGTQVTLGEAVAFLLRDRQAATDAGARRSRGKATVRRAAGHGMEDLFAEGPE